MPVGIRTHGRGPPKQLGTKDVPRNPRAHFRNNSPARPLRPITQQEVDAALADAPVAVAEYQRSAAGREDVRRNENAVAINRRDYGEGPLPGVPHYDRSPRPHTPGSN